MTTKKTKKAHKPSLDPAVAAHEAVRRLTGDATPARRPAPKRAKPTKTRP